MQHFIQQGKQRLVNPVGYNCCYANAALQLLLRISAFTTLLLSLGTIAPINHSRRFLIVLVALAAQWANDRTVQLHVETLVHALGRLHPEFVAIERKSRKQHCAMEFITKVIEIMAETLQELEEYKAVSKLNTIFNHGILKLTWCCNAVCDNTYARLERYNTVAAKMDESMVNLTSLLEKTFFGESITDYHCDGADCRRLGVNLAARFGSLPECLLIDLNRSAKSAWVGGHFVHQKFNAKLNFPSELDVRRFCTTECAETQGTMYELDAILLHTGTTRAGHWCILQRVSPTMFWLRNDAEAPQAVPQDLALTEYREHTAALLYRRTPFRPARASNFNQALGERAPEPDCVLPITSFPPAVPLSPPVQMSPQMTWQTAHAHRRSHRASANAAVLPAQAPISGSVNGFVKKTPPLPLGTPAGLVGPCSSFAMLRQAQADARRDDRFSSFHQAAAATRPVASATASKIDSRAQFPFSSMLAPPRTNASTSPRLQNTAGKAADRMTAPGDFMGLMTRGPASVVHMSSNAAPLRSNTAVHLHDHGRHTLAASARHSSGARLAQTAASKAVPASSQHATALMRGNDINSASEALQREGTAAVIIHKGQSTQEAALPAFSAVMPCTSLDIRAADSPAASSVADSNRSRKQPRVMTPNMTSGTLIDTVTAQPAGHSTKRLSGAETPLARQAHSRTSGLLPTMEQQPFMSARLSPDVYHTAPSSAADVAVVASSVACNNSRHESKPASSDSRHLSACSAVLSRGIAAATAAAKPLPVPAKPSCAASPSVEQLLAATSAPMQPAAASQSTALSPVHVLRRLPAADQLVRQLSEASDGHADVGAQEVLQSVSGQSATSPLNVSSSATSANTVEMTPARMWRSAVAISACAGIPIPTSSAVDEGGLQEEDDKWADREDRSRSRPGRRGMFRKIVRGVRSWAKNNPGAAVCMAGAIGAGCVKVLTQKRA